MQFQFFEIDEDEAIEADDQRAVHNLSRAEWARGAQEAGTDRLAKDDAALACARSPSTTAISGP
jgi:hypothetical protein